MTARIKVCSSNSMHGVLDDLVPAFERASGNTVAVNYDLPQVMVERIRNGETADLAVMIASAIDELEKLGSIAAGSRRVLARFGIGIGMRAGAPPKPDIGSVGALKRVLLEAGPIAYTSEGISGIHFSRIIERLGIAAEVKAKAVRRPGGLIAELVLRGEAEIAVQQIPELMAVPGIELIGALPPEFQKMTVLSAGIFANAKQPEKVFTLLEFLSAPASAKVFRAKGLEPAQG